MKNIDEINQQIRELEKEKAKLKKEEFNKQVEGFYNKILEICVIDFDDVVNCMWSNGDVPRRIQVFGFGWRDCPTYETFQKNGYRFEYENDDYRAWYDVTKTDNTRFSFEDLEAFEKLFKYYKDNPSNSLRRTVMSKIEDKTYEFRRFCRLTKDIRKNES